MWSDKKSVMLCLRLQDTLPNHKRMDKGLMFCTVLWATIRKFIQHPVMMLLCSIYLPLRLMLYCLVSIFTVGNNKSWPFIVKYEAHIWNLSIRLVDWRFQLYLDSLRTRILIDSHSHLFCAQAAVLTTFTISA